MKYIITGSTGNVSKPLAQNLLNDGHQVTVISSDSSKEESIRKLGATPAIGDIRDLSFLTDLLKQADAAYLMIPPVWNITDWLGFYREIADGYVQAVMDSGIHHVVLLSSIGAHAGSGCGPIDGLAYLEDRFKALSEVNTLALRPTYFYTNFYNQIPLIKQAGIMGANYGGPNNKLVMVHPKDIAAVAARRLSDLDFTGFSFQYISGAVLDGKAIANILGEAIDRSDLNWVVFSDEDTKASMRQAGASDSVAEEYVEMGKAFRTEHALSDYLSKPRELNGKISLADFAGEFAEAFKAN